MYQHPLAYLLGLEGIALLHAFAGEYDRDFTLDRLAEIRALLAAGEELGDGVMVDPIPTTEGYGSWAEFYDEPGNQLIDVEQPIVREMLDGLPRGIALDAACGTGRHTAYLASLGHTVIGVDSSATMLERARERVPSGEFHEADLHALPLPDDHVDLVLCALALMHVPDLEPVLAEFVRVLRPGGNLVISDWRPLVKEIALPLVKAGPDGSPGYMPTKNRLTSEYLAAALPLGLQVRRCEEPRTPFPLADDSGTPADWSRSRGIEPPCRMTRGRGPTSEKATTEAAHALARAEEEARRQKGSRPPAPGAARARPGRGRRLSLDRPLPRLERRLRRRAGRRRARRADRRGPRDLPGRLHDRRCAVSRP
ncbi:MAG: class I SAM-dependent methyltransferase [Actinobacteria bacterium]|nr:MAG: class I SAM-dependent methyltransferase [Actinomycetota bacterium]